MRRKNIQEICWAIQSLSALIRLLLEFVEPQFCLCIQRANGKSRVRGCKSVTCLFDMFEPRHRTRTNRESAQLKSGTRLLRAYNCSFSETRCLHICHRAFDSSDVFPLAQSYVPRFRNRYRFLIQLKFSLFKKISSESSFFTFNLILYFGFAAFLRID